MRGADSAKSFRTVQVSSSRHTPTTERESPDEKLSRGGPLSESRIDIGFISYSEIHGSIPNLPEPISAVDSYQIQVCPETSLGSPGSAEADCLVSPGPLRAVLQGPLVRCCCG